MEVSKNWDVIKASLVHDPTDLIEPPPWERGVYKYHGPGNVERQEEIEKQVPGSLGRWGYPKYKSLHYKIKGIVENLIGEELYPTYHYDRYYFKGQDLSRHRDRPACEVSVTYHVSSNADYSWPIYFQRNNSDAPVGITCLPGDAVVYRGCDLWHWREPLMGNHKTYFHQIFFHYVRANGPYVQYADDWQM